MKITFVLSEPWNLSYNLPMGGYKVVYEYANCLVRQGHEVTIVYFRKLVPFSDNFPFALLLLLDHPRKWLVYKIGMPKISWYDLHKDVKRVVATDLNARRVPDADAIFATWWPTASVVSECPCNKGAKFYLVQDFPLQMPDQESELKQTWRLPLKKIAVSSWMAECILRSGAEDVEVIPNAVDHSRFRVMNDIRGRAKRIAMLYSPVSYKRSHFGLSVLSMCKEAVPNLEVSMFGPRRSPLGRLARPPSWIQYHGYVSERELVNLYNAASIYLCSSAAEGFALPPAEAMACGCAVATTDCGGNRDYAEHEKTALVSDPDDFTSLTNNVLRLLSDEELRVKIALAGRDRISRFTWDKSTTQLIKFIDRHT